MNLIDYAILACLGLSVLIGLYRGFMSTSLNTLGLLLSLFIAYLCYPLVSGWIAAHQTWMDYIVYLSEGSSHIPTAMMEFARSDVAALSAADTAQVIASASFTPPFDAYLAQNIAGHVYGPARPLLADYFDQTVADASLNLLSFVLCAGVTYLLASLLVGLADKTFRFPLLVQLDSISGGAVGLVRGYLLLMLFFTLVPLVMNMLQIDFLNDLVLQSKLSSWFFPDNWFFSWIKPVL